MVYDISGNLIGDMHWRDTGEVQEGDELELETGVLVQVEDYVEQKDTNLNGLLVDHSQRSSSAKSPLRASAGIGGSISTQFTPSAPKTQGQTQVGAGRMKTLNELLGSKRPQIGKAAPQLMRSPYEQKHATQSPAAVPDQAMKVQKVADKQKSLFQSQPGNSSIRGNSNKGFEPSTATRGEGRDEANLLDREQPMKRNAPSGRYSSAYQKNDAHQIRNQQEAAILPRTAHHNESTHNVQPLHSTRMDASVSVSREGFSRNPASSIQDIGGHSEDFTTTDSENPFGLSPWETPVPAPIAEVEEDDGTPQAEREPPRKKRLLHEETKTSSVIDRVENVIARQSEARPEHSDGTQIAFKRPVPPENPTGKLRLAKGPPRKKLMLGSLVPEKAPASRNIGAEIHQRPKLGKINNSERLISDRQGEQRTSRLSESSSHDGDRFTQDDETLSSNEDSMVENPSAQQNMLMDFGSHGASNHTDPRQSFRQFSSPPPSPAKEQVTRTLRIAPDKPRKKLIFQDLSSHVLEKSRSTSSSGAAAAGFSSASLVASDPKAFNLHRPKAIKEPESPQKPTTTIHNFFKSQTHKSGDCRQTDNSSTQAGETEKSAIPVVLSELQTAKLDFGGNNQQSRLQQSSDTKASFTNSLHRNDRSIEVGKPAITIPTSTTSRQTSLASFVGKRQGPIPEDSNPDSDGDGDAYDNEDDAEEQGPWTREAMFLFDWWPPDRDKPSVAPAEKPTAGPALEMKLV